MDTTTAIMMLILEDLGETKNNQLTRKYSTYYESLDEDQSKTVVSNALNKIVKDNNATCEFGEDTFTLKM